MRLIDADKLIEAMGEEPYVWTDSAEEIAERNQWLADMHIIESAPTIDAPTWIPCSERLPSEEEQDANLGVLVTLGHGYKGMDFDWYHDGHWYDWDRCVIAWMPLPKPYKETDHE